MRPLLTPQEMAEADRATMAGGTSGEVLMERAGRAVVRAVVGLAGARYGRRVAVVCGPGNNGGDGFVAARFAKREGLGVTCLFVGDSSRISGAAAHHLGRMRDSGLDIRPFRSAALAGSDVIVDALFGTGFHGAASGEAAAAIDAINNRNDARVVAVDIPSGVDGMTGAALGSAVQAGVTVVMAAQKIGTAIGQGAVLSGRIEVADIGIEVFGAQAWMTEAGDVAALLPMRAPDSHKRSGGSVAILGGASGMSGAVVLAARAAVRAGAGYATAGVTKDVEAVVSVAAPEVLTVVLGDDVLGPDSLDGFKTVIDRASVLAIGPGLGTGPAQTELVAKVLETVDLPVVVDADALNVLAGRTSVLTARSSPAVISPHPGELARLLESSAEEIQADRVASVRAAADRFGCTVVLKGHRTLVAKPDGPVLVNPTGGPELATAGTGDVLTGTLAALIAGGLDPFDAAWMGAYVHGLAGAIAARGTAVAGVLAGDVAEALPQAMSELQHGDVPVSREAD